MKKRNILLSALLAASLAWNASAQNLNFDRAQFHVGDNPEWKSAAFDDSAWQSLVVGETWDMQGIHNNEAFAWYRLKFVMPESLLNASDMKTTVKFNLGCIDDGYDFTAEKGTRLPLTAKFKGNTSVRYEWDLNPRMKANVQASAAYEGARTRDIRPPIQDIYGKLKAYTLVDIGAGIDMDHWSVDLFVKNLFDTRGQIAKSLQCNEFVCGDVNNDTAIGGKIYTTVTRPRTMGIRVGYKF